MKVVTYMCENCFEPYEFDGNDVRDKYICPACGDAMMYWSTSEIDESTDKVVSDYIEESRRIQSPGKPMASEFKHLNSPTVTCPYCKSTNTKKISGLSKAVSVGLFGIFALGKTTKQFHCNSCSADF